MEKVKKEDYNKHCIKYNGVEYCLGDMVRYAPGGIYKDDGGIVPYTEEAEIVALDTSDAYDESDYQSQAVIMLNRVTKNGTYLNDLGDDEGIVCKKGAKKYNEWALFSEIEKCEV